MKLVDKWRAGREGRNARETLGAGEVPAIAEPIAGNGAALPCPDDGWTRDRERRQDLLEISRVIPDPEQPRRQFDPEELQRLGANVKRRGILQAVRVRWLAERGLWMLVCGERRLAAATAAGLSHLPATRTVGELTRVERLQEQLAENDLRSDLNPIDRAEAYRELMAEAGWTETELAANCDRSQPTVSRALKLLELATPVQADVRARRIAPKVAVELAGLPAELQAGLAAKIVAENWSAERTADAVARLAGETAPGNIHGEYSRGRGRPPKQSKPRVVIELDDGDEVTVRTAGDVVAALRKAIRVHLRKQSAAPSAGAA